MALYLLIFSAIVVICIFFNKFSGKFGIPVLLLFLVLGLLCGSQYDGFASNWCSNKFNGCSDGLLHSAFPQVGPKEQNSPSAGDGTRSSFLAEKNQLPEQWLDTVSRSVSELR